MTTAQAREPEIVEQEVAPTLPMTAGGSVDVQVATARRYPRSIATFIRRATEMATLTPEIAASCVYALPRGGKTIEGPSARLAEIVASAWGNLRIQAGATDNDERYITARGEAWDVESNVAIGFEVRRRITNRKGDTYDDDMITVTGNAAASIALRNAVFKAVPSSFWKPIYQKCRHVIAGDAKTFAARRDDMLKAFMVAGVTPERLCAGIGLKGVADITLDHMATLVGVLNAIKEGETTIEEAFPEGGGLGAPQASTRKSRMARSQQRPTPAQADEARSRETPSAATRPRRRACLASVTTGSRQAPPASSSTSRRRAGAFMVKLDTGFICATRDASPADGARVLQKAGVRVELTCTPPKRSEVRAEAEEITPLDGAAGVTTAAMTAAALTFDAERHEYRLPDARLVPSVTQILHAVGVATDFDAIAARAPKMAEAIEFRRALGTAAHADCHAFDDCDLDWTTVDERVRPYVEAWASSARTPADADARERRVFHPVAFYCGTLDGIFVKPNGAARCWSTSSSAIRKTPARSTRPPPTRPRILVDHPGQLVSERWAVQLLPERRIPYDITNYSARADAWRDFQKFQAFVTTFHEQAIRRRTR
jgi:hypothetical protein